MGIIPLQWAQKCKHVLQKFFNLNSALYTWMSINIHNFVHWRIYCVSYKHRVSTLRSLRLDRWIENNTSFLLISIQSGFPADLSTDTRWGSPSACCCCCASSLVLSSSRMYQHHYPSESWWLSDWSPCLAWLPSLSHSINFTNNCTNDPSPPVVQLAVRSRSALNPAQAVQWMEFTPLLLTRSQW